MEVKQTMYCIKVYSKSSNGTLKFIEVLPYLFFTKPFNICEQLNIMLGDSFEHIIALYDGE